MGDLCFAESLGMLEGSDYSPWVKAIFGGVKNGTQLRSFKMLNNFSNYLMEEWVFKSEAVRSKQFEHWNYSKERINRRLTRNPDRPDIWTKILEKGAPDEPNALSLGEHHSTGSVFMMAGTETTATALSGTTYHLLMNPDKLELLQREIRSAFTSLDEMDLESLARQKYLMAVLQEGLRMYPPVPTLLPRVGSRRHDCRCPSPIHVQEPGVLQEAARVPPGALAGRSRVQRRPAVCCGAV
jgi:cytochrome P450